MKGLITCEYCRRRNKADNEVCSGCGAPLHEEEHGVEIVYGLYSGEHITVNNLSTLQPVLVTSYMSSSAPNWRTE